ncbi:MAG: transglycosylase SLT domain-containing protein [Caldilineaceae bacterium]|nr:transglycosylase SLT domain-containing protein [Caldilineaceae bacterium]
MNWFSKHSGRGEPLWLWIFAAIGGLALMALAVWAGYQLWLFRNSGSLAFANATPTTQAVPTFTATPGGIGKAQVAGLEAASTPDPFDTEAMAAESGAIQAAPGEPTPVPPLEAEQPVVPAQRTITIDDIAPNADQSPPPTPAPPTPTPTVPPAPEDQLTQGIQLHRVGDFVAARSRLAALINDPAATQEVRLDARFYLAKGYLADGYYAEALAVLEQLDTEFDTATTGLGAPTAAFDRQVEAHLLRALVFTGMARYADAIDAYDQALAQSPELAALVQPRIARANAALGDSANAATAYRAAVDAATDTVQQVVLLEALASTYSGAGRYDEAVAAYDEILEVAVNAGYRAQIQYQAGEVLRLAGDETNAIVRWRRATDEAPSTNFAYQALIRLVERQVDFDLYQRGLINLAASSWQPAVNALTAYLDLADADDARRDTALHMLGQAYLGLGDLPSAATVFARVIAEYPDCTCFGQAWIDSARTQAAGGDGTDARRTYRTFARDYPNDPLAPEALWRSGVLALNEDSTVEAAVDLLSLVDLFPKSDRAPQALYTVGVGAFANELYVESADALRRAQMNYPDYRWDAVGYWLGRAQAANGDRADAEETWQALVERAPDIYYGVMAAQAMRQLAGTDGAIVNMRNMRAVAGPPSRVAGDDGSRAFAEQWLADWLRVDADTLGQLPAAVTDDPDWVAGQMFLAVDERGDGLAALERVYTRNQNDSATLYAMSLEFERLQAYRLSLIAMARLLQFSPAGLVENAPLFLQQHAYPRRFADLITAESIANGIEPLLFFSLIRQESLFEEGARSFAAAQGLAQIIPDTGQWVAERLGYPNYSNELVYRPYINVKFGAYYLDWVRDYLDGNLVSALVGYNAGPGNSDIWREAAGADDALFVEQLTITEPRIYVQAVVSNLYHYTRMYDTGQ